MMFRRREASAVTGKDWCAPLVGTGHMQAAQGGGRGEQGIGRKRRQPRERINLTVMNCCVNRWERKKTRENWMQSLHEQNLAITQKQQEISWYRCCNIMHYHFLFAMTSHLLKIIFLHDGKAWAWKTYLFFFCLYGLSFRAKWCIF